MGRSPGEWASDGGRMAAKAALASLRGGPVADNRIDTGASPKEERA